MSANKYLPHLVVVPEDEANRQIMTGFCKHNKVNSRQIQIEAVADGWRKVPKYFIENLAVSMRRLDKRYVLLMVDFDEQGEGRLAEITGQIPEDLRERVFVLGTSREPEAFSRDEGLGLEDLGSELAKECLQAGGKLWETVHLNHNLPELRRMRDKICGQLTT